LRITIRKKKRFLFLDKLVSSMKLIIILYGIVVLLNWSVDSRLCNICSCQHDWGTNTGTCSSPTFLGNCRPVEVGNEYCFMISIYNGNIEQRIFEAVAPDTFQDSHFIQAVETISLSGTVWLSTQISSIGYGCDWDGCNDISLAQYLPESFQMKISQTVLNEVLINGQLPAQLCYTCSKCINDLTAILCKQTTCNNGICYIDEIHNYIVTATNNCTYNFFSNCESLNEPAQTPSVRIRATYYIDFPQEKQLEIDEVDMRCRKDFCNSIEVVENLKGQIQTTIDLHPDFRPVRPTVTTTTTSTSTAMVTTTQGSTSTTTIQGSTSTTTTQGSTSTTPSQGSTSTTPSQGSTSTPTSTTTTTNQGSKSTRSYHTSFLYLILSLLLF
jgi:hypothetical protein